MNNRTNQILLAVFSLTAALYAYFLLVWLEIVPSWLGTSFRYTSLGAYVCLGFHVIPCFCLQLLVCRTAKRRMVRLIPVFLLTGFAACSIVNFVNAFMVGSWDAVGWGTLLCLCIAPMVGYALAWAVYGVCRAAASPR